MPIDGDEFYYREKDTLSTRTYIKYIHLQNVDGTYDETPDRTDRYGAEDGKVKTLAHNAYPSFKGFEIDYDRSPGEKEEYHQEGNTTIYSLHLYYKRLTNKVTFISNGETVKEKTFAYGASLNGAADDVSLTPPAKDGTYVFSGEWYDNALLAGEPFDFSTTMHEGEIILYAKWNIEDVTVTFYNDGEVYAKRENLPVGSFVTFPDNDPAQDGFVFDGWVTESGKPFVRSTKVYEDLSLYASWRSTDSIRVAYVAAEEGFDAPEDKKSYRDKAQAFAMEAPEANSYASEKVFLGWRLPGGDICQPGAAFTVDAGQTAKDNDGQLVFTLTAVFGDVPMETSIIYDPNGGEGDAWTDSVQINNGTYMVLSATNGNFNYSREEGYIFIGWNTKKDGTGASYAASEQIAVSNSDPLPNTLYAQWEIVKVNEVTLTVTKTDANGNPLQGAEFTLTAADDEEVARESSGNDGKVEFKFTSDPGEGADTYTLEETTAPAGYARDDAKRTITVSRGARDDTQTGYDESEKVWVTTYRLVVSPSNLEITNQPDVMQEYKVTYRADANGTVGNNKVNETTQTDQKLSNSKITGETAYPNAGYTFDGWYKGDEKIASEAKLSADDARGNLNKDGDGLYADTTYEARFRSNDDTSYTIEFYYQVGGAYNDKDKVVEKRTGTTDTEAEVTDEDKRPTKEGYVFDESNENNVLSGTIEGDGSLVLKVYFKQQFTVVYAPGTNGTWDAEEDGTISELDYGAEMQGPDLDPEADGMHDAGYVFAGWQAEDGTVYATTEALLDAVKTVTKDATYIAQWKAKPVVTITINDLSKVYGDDEPGYSATVEGLVEGDTISYKLFRDRYTDENGQTLENNWNNLEGVGKHEIKIDEIRIESADGEDVTDNYEIKDVVPGQLTITPRPITITADSASKTYDGTVLTCSTYKITSGSLAGDDFGMEEIRAIVIEGSQTEVGSSANRVASVEIRKNPDTTGNYAISYVDGELSVTPAGGGGGGTDPEPPTPAGETYIFNCFQPEENIIKGSHTESTCTDSNYETVLINGHCFMKENLRIETDNSKVFNTTENPANEELFGRLYTREDAETVCPSGWHLPTIVEVAALTTFESEGLRTADYWINPGFNTSGFTAYPAGFYNAAANRFEDFRSATYFHTSDENVIFKLDYYCCAVRLEYANPNNAYSVRCAKDN